MGHAKAISLVLLGLVAGVIVSFLSLTLVLRDVACLKATLTTSDDGSPVAATSTSALSAQRNKTAYHINPSSPVASMVGGYPNTAIENEMNIHNRWVVDAISYFQEWTRADSERYASERNPSKKENKFASLIIFTANRAVPYLAVGLSVLLRGHDPHLLMEKANFHVINTERRITKKDERYYLFDQLQEKLPFIEFHSWTDDYPQYQHLAHDNEQYFLANQKADFIRAIGICREERTKFCITLEDDAVPTVDFLPKFEKLVQGEVPNNLRLDEIGVIKLYAPFNDGQPKQEGR